MLADFQDSSVVRHQVESFTAQKTGRVTIACNVSGIPLTKFHVTSRLFGAWGITSFPTYLASAHIHGIHGMPATTLPSLRHVHITRRGVSIVPMYAPLTDITRRCAPSVHSVRCLSPPMAVLSLFMHSRLPRNMSTRSPLFMTGCSRPAAASDRLSAAFLIVVRAPMGGPADSHATRVIRQPDALPLFLMHLRQRW